MALSSQQRTVLGYATTAARFYGLDPTIFFAQLWQESRLRWDQQGTSGEIGPGQFMAGTWPGVILGHPELSSMFGAEASANGRFNVIANVFASAAHMADLVVATGSYVRALSRYNGGNSDVGEQNGIANGYATLVLNGADTMTNGPTVAGTNTDAEIAAAIAAAGGGGGTGEQIVSGQTLIDADGNRFIAQVQQDGRVGFLFLGSDALEPQWRPFSGSFTTELGTAITFANGQVTSTRPLSAAEAAAAGLPFSVPGGGTGGLSLDEQIELLTAQAAIARREGDHARAADFENQIDILRRQQQFTDEQRQKSEEFSLKVNRLGALDQLTNTLVNLQSQNRIASIQAIGQDPFGGAIQAQGGISVGRSPFERLRRQSREFSQQELPSVAPNASIEEVNQAIDDALGLVTSDPRTQAEPLLGVAHGGVIDMAPDEDGVFRNVATGESGAELVVGELGPELIRNAGEGRLQVIPLGNRESARDTTQVGGRDSFAVTGRLSAQSGGFFDIDVPEGERQFSVQGLAPLFSALGFDQIPFGNRAPDAFGGVGLPPQQGSGFGGLSGITPADASTTFQQLGTRPRLIFEPRLQTFLFVNAQGQVQDLGPDATSLDRFGVNSSEAQTLTLEQLEQMGFTVGTGGERQPGQPQVLNQLQPGSDVFFSGANRGAFPELGPLRLPLNEEGTINVLLPDPRLLANVWNQLDLRTQTLAISAYGRAGVQEGQLLRRLRFFRGESAGRPTARIA